MPHQPTPGNCLEDAFTALLERTHDQPGARCRLVHGYPKLTRANGGYPVGTLYGHAWLERVSIPADFGKLWTPGTVSQLLGLMSVVCIDVYKGAAVPAAAYYAVGQIDPTWCHQYTETEAVAAALRHGTYGPWEPGPPGAVWAAV